MSLVLPLGGVSMIDAPGQPFADPEPIASLFETLRASVAPHVRVVDVDAHINDPRSRRRSSARCSRLLDARDSAPSNA